MRKEYDLLKLKKRPGKTKVDRRALKVPISLRLDAAVLSDLKSEAARMGIPYQTLVGSVLHRYAHGELVDPKAADLAKVFTGVG